MEHYENNLEKPSWTQPIIVELNVSSTRDVCNDGTKLAGFDDGLCSTGVGTS